ncbi:MULTISPECIES: transcriptional regulator domain-containing protein [Alphaproteobacteria]|uniref:transcriptional regulator domain-containing protein n=1 Tax=Alphaproteobacteria TaxID=28211 RepID=UPI001AE5F53C|nr:DUF6499 domain-containing protein [Sphingomonas sp. BE137]MDR6849946.1 hypothetical protein [Sphingomonas sp. BE137]
MSDERRGRSSARRNLDFAGFAQEFLRRNPDYRRDFLALSANAPSAAPATEAEVMARRWGLCFPVRAGRFAP